MTMTFDVAMRMFMSTGLNHVVKCVEPKPEHVEVVDVEVMDAEVVHVEVVHVEAVHVMLVTVEPEGDATGGEIDHNCPF